ncbi:hypothetical protein [Frankia sp. Cr1]|uniref:hypothetical protein n=1 Tax=Frankia sp. Cr1 TaxID=3073931 RepID=UPI002AD4B47E|nr:hypothetical protein [Frankia sp. Cr1]
MLISDVLLLVLLVLVLVLVLVLAIFLGLYAGKPLVDLTNLERSNVRMSSRSVT